MGIIDERNGAVMWQVQVCCLGRFLLRGTILAAAQTLQTWKFGGNACAHNTSSRVQARERSKPALSWPTIRVAVAVGEQP